MRACWLAAMGSALCVIGTAFAQPGGESMMLPAPVPTSPGSLSGPMSFSADAASPDGAPLPYFPPIEVVSASGPRYWFDAEYLLWWVKNDGLSAPLVVGGADLDAIAAAGEIPVLLCCLPCYQESSGFGLGFGWWMDPFASWGLEARGFLLEQQGRGARFRSDGSSLLGIPYIEAFTGNQEVLQIAGPFGFASATSGALHAATTTQAWGSEANAIVNLKRSGLFTLDLITGFRYFGVDDSLSLIAHTSFDRPSIFMTDLTTYDLFRTNNRFYGGQLGLRGQCRLGIWYLEASGKLALGGTQQTLTIDGWSNNTTIVYGELLPTLSGPSAGGIFAQLSNMGRHSGSRFAVLPEVKVRLGVELLENVKSYVGYTFLYLSSVVRPGEQIDPVLNFSQGPAVMTIPGPVRPIPLMRRGDFWAQGLDFGLQIDF
ncbi:MAG: BBP7 family outer membrane beta-barrel protein [Gemmataceae bacterium]